MSRHFPTFTALYSVFIGHFKNYKKRITAIINLDCWTLSRLFWDIVEFWLGDGLSFFAREAGRTEEASGRHPRILKVVLVTCYVRVERTQGAQYLLFGSCLKRACV